MDLSGKQLFAVLRKMGEVGCTDEELASVLKLSQPAVRRVVRALQCAIRTERLAPIPLEHSLAAFDGAEFVAGHNYVADFGSTVYALHWADTLKNGERPWRVESVESARERFRLTRDHTLSDLFDFTGGVAATSDLALFFRQWPEHIPEEWRDGREYVFPGTMMRLHSGGPRVMLELRMSELGGKPSWSYPQTHEKLSTTWLRESRLVFMNRDYVLPVARQNE